MYYRNENKILLYTRAVYTYIYIYTHKLCLLFTITRNQLIIINKTQHFMQVHHKKSLYSVRLKKKPHETQRVRDAYCKSNTT